MGKKDRSLAKIRKSFVDWQVAHVSIVRTAKQATQCADDIILECLLEDIETNLQWENYYREERIKILPQGLWFMKKTLYRRMQIVSSYLHALKSKRLREGKSVRCIPVTIMIELILKPQKLVNYDEIVDILRPTAIPFCPEFRFDRMRKKLLRVLSFSGLKSVNVLIKMHIRTPVLHRPTRASGSGVSKYESETEDETDEWIDQQTLIDEDDADELWESGRSTIAHVEVLLVKPICIHD